MDFSVLQFLYLALAAFGTAAFHSVAAFAGGLLLAVLVAPVVGIKETVPMISVALMISQSARFVLFREAVDWRVFLNIVALSFPCLVLGALLYITLPVNAVALVLGVFLIAMVPLRRYMQGREVHVGLMGLRVVAVPYGIISGTAFGVGLLLAPFLLGAGLIGETLVATVAAIAIVTNVTKTVIFGFTPLMTRHLFLAGAMIGALTIPGHYFGRWIVRRTSIRVHTLLIEAIILAGACYFIWQAGRGYGWF